MLLNGHIGHHNDVGSNTFTDVTDAMPLDLSSHYNSGIAAADYDLDGWVDIVVATETFNEFSARPVLLHNLGGWASWVSLQLQGTVSNRDAVGARVEVQSSGVYQMRDAYAGSSFLSMDSQWLHFGLGEAGNIDLIRVTWPSGTVQVIEQLQPNQHVTLVEPRDVLPVSSGIHWERSLPDTVVSGREVYVEGIVVRDDAADLGVVADLSRLGGPANLALNRLGPGRYRFTSRFFPSVENGLAPILLRLELADGQLRNLLHPIAVLPASDQVLFDDALSSTWNFDFGSLHPEPSEKAFEGVNTLTVKSTLGFFDFVFEPEEPFPTTGYELRFAFHPGNVEFTTGTSFKVSFGRRSTLWETTLLLGNGGTAIDLNHREWQTVSVPLAPFGTDYLLESFAFSGFMRGTYHLDDLRLAAARSPQSTTISKRSVDRPESFALLQNTPNPFNGETAIPFHLRRDSDRVRLEIYNVMGQKAVTLFNSRLGGGSHTLSWNGRDEVGTPLSSGVFFYRLQTDTYSATRKLLLLR